MTTTTPVAALATLINGRVTADAQILTDEGHLVYASPWGVVKLQRYGHVVVTLGAWHEPPAALAAAYESAVSS